MQLKIITIVIFFILKNKNDEYNYNIVCMCSMINNFYLE